MSDDTSTHHTDDAITTSPDSAHQPSPTSKKGKQNASKTRQTRAPDEDTLADRRASDELFDEASDEAGDDRDESSATLVKSPAEESPKKIVPHPSSKPRAKRTLAELAQELSEILPASDEDLPDHLYSPTSKNYDVTKLIVFEGI